jgi:hypothetical protein
MTIFTPARNSYTLNNPNILLTDFKVVVGMGKRDSKTHKNVFKNKLKLLLI